MVMAVLLVVGFLFAGCDALNDALNNVNNDDETSEKTKDNNDKKKDNADDKKKDNDNGDYTTMAYDDFEGTWISTWVNDSNNRVIYVFKDKTFALYTNGKNDGVTFQGTFLLEGTSITLSDSQYNQKWTFPGYTLTATTLTIFANSSQSGWWGTYTKQPE